MFPIHEFPSHEDDQQVETAAYPDVVRSRSRTNKRITHSSKTLAETFSGEHPAADVDDAFDTELDNIRQQNRLGSRASDWDCCERGSSSECPVTNKG